MTRTPGQERARALDRVEPHTLVRARDPDTSHEAAAYAPDFSASHWAMILDALIAAGADGHMGGVRAPLERRELDMKIKIAVSAFSGVVVACAMFAAFFTAYIALVLWLTLLPAAGVMYLLGWLV